VRLSMTLDDAELCDGILHQLIGLFMIQLT
jgi:hypothetical protein